MAAAILLVFTGVAHAEKASAPAMITPGQFTVSGAGAFNYTIPIAVPLGTAGMTPTLSLDYSSQTGDGFEGLGWTLTGIPSIVRCPRTIAQDGVHGGVNFDGNDRFCMEGQRLILIGGIYGADGSSYRTEIEGFSQITAHGTAGNGPAWFQVRTKAGQTMEFGNTTDSLILAQGKTTARAWAMDKATDTAGNYLTVTYVNDATNGQAYPSRIDYTGNTAASLATYNSVRFSYASRADITPTYQAGSLMQTTQLLTDVKTYAGATNVADYQMAYQAGTSTTHSELTSVTQCDGNASQTCLPPTTFGWQGSRASPVLTTNSVAGYNGPDPYHYVVPADLNGDGVTDIITNNPSTCGLLYGNQTPGAFTQSGIVVSYTEWEFDGTNYTPMPVSLKCLDQVPVQYHFPDFDGNGYTDMSFVQSVAHNVTNGFTLLNNTMGAINEVSQFQSAGINADFNGDGRSDYLAASSVGGPYMEYMSQGNGAFCCATGNLSIGPNFVLGDFDGDGCADVIDQKASNKIVFSCQPAIATYATGIPQTDELIVGDFNGDGKSDILDISLSGGGALYLSTGVGLTKTSFTVPSDWYKYAIVVGDFTGDGKSDIALIADGQAGQYGVGTPHSIWMSTGTGFVQIDTIANTNSQDTHVVPVVADWNNDGATDLWLQKASGDAQSLFSYIPEVIHTVTNGIGVTTTVTYDRLNRAAVYAKDTNGTYPTLDLNGPFYVVSQLTSSNAIGGNYVSTYAYTGAKEDLQGRGFLGFDKMSVTDSQTGVVQTTTYLQAFPYIGLVASQTKALGAVTLSSVTNDYKSTTLGPGSPGSAYYFVYMDSSVAAGADLDGSVLPTVTTTYAYDNFGNPTTVAVSTPDQATKTTTNTFDNDTTHWFLGRLRTAQVTSTVGSSTITRSTSYTYDPNTGLLTQEVIEPSGGALRLETDYSYDGFGNRTLMAVAGSGVESRGAGQTFDAQGRFATTRTNAINQNESWAYSAAFGLPTRHVDIDNMTSTWVYDTFGRATLATATDGTQTSFTYLYCAGVFGGSAACPANAAFLVQATPLGTDGATKIGPQKITYYDALSRAIAGSVQGFDNSIIRVDTPYDANGRVAQTSRPYFISGGTPQWTVNTYDALGRVTKIVMPDTSKTSFAFHGLTTAATNDKNQTTTTVKNDEGLIARVSDAAGGTTSYVYDAFGDLTQTTSPAGAVITNTFDIRGRKTASSDPDMGAWTYGYDPFGELVNQTDAKGQSISFTYDLLGRLVQRTEPDLISNWTYDTAPWGVGKLAKATSSNGAEQDFSFDNKGRPYNERLIINGGTSNYSSTYDTLTGRRATLTYPSGLSISYLYNNYGYLLYLRDSNTNATYWTANSRDAELHLLTQTLGNHITTTQAFDPTTGRVQSIQAGVANAVANFGYTFDTLGNLTGRQDMNEALTETYSYDTLNRLHGSLTNGVSRIVTYDADGDIQSKSGVGSYGYGNGAGPHAVTSVSGTVNGVSNPTFSYDADGDMIAGAGRTLTWTSFNMASVVVGGGDTTMLSYNSEHARILGSASEGVTTYLNDPATGGMAEIFAAAGVTTTRDYLMAEGVLVGIRSTTGGTSSWQYMVTDHLGSVAVITDQGGAVVQRLSYDAWGSRRNPDGTTSTSPIVADTTRGFTGQEAMDDFGLINFNARLYDPQLGRFLSADPTIENSYIGQLLDRYSYVGNNPLSLTDPSGLCFLGCFWDSGIFRDLLAIVVAFTLQYELLPEVLAGEEATFNSLSLLDKIIDVGLSGGAAGAISTGTLKGALLGAAEAAAFFEVGSGLQAEHLTGATPQAVAAAFVAHGAVGGLFSVAGGGNFGSGFLAAGVASLGDNVKLDNSNVIAGAAEHAVLGGLGSVLGGGKFENGAVTGAFGYLFNSLAHAWVGTQATYVLGGYLIARDGPGSWFINQGSFWDLLLGSRADLVQESDGETFELKTINCLTNPSCATAASAQLEGYIANSDGKLHIGNNDSVFQGLASIIVPGSVWSVNIDYAFSPSLTPGLIGYTFFNQSSVLSQIWDVYRERKGTPPSTLPFLMPIPVIP